MQSARPIISILRPARTTRAKDLLGFWNESQALIKADPPPHPARPRSDERHFNTCWHFAYTWASGVNSQSPIGDYSARILEHDQRPLANLLISSYDKVDGVIKGGKRPWPF